MDGHGRDPLGVAAGLGLADAEHGDEVGGALVGVEDQGLEVQQVLLLLAVLGALGVNPLPLDSRRALFSQLGLTHLHQGREGVQTLLTSEAVCPLLACEAFGFVVCFLHSLQIATRLDSHIN